MMTTEIQWIFLMLSLSANAEVQNAIEYTFNTGNASWNQAQTYCKDRGMRLVTLKTQEKFKSFLELYWDLNTIGQIHHDMQWIGLYDSEPPNMIYNWTDCTPLSPLFSPWDMEPNFPEGEKCVRMTTELIWRTTTCHKSLMFTCERDLANCLFEEVVGRPLYFSVVSADSLDDCKNECLKNSKCLAVQFYASKCHASESNSLLPIVNEVTYRKVCINYTITHDEFVVENPPQTEGTVDCKSVSTTMQEDFGRSTVNSHIIHLLTSLSQQPFLMSTDLESTPNPIFSNIKASSMKNTPSPNHHRTSEHIEALPMTTELQPTYPTFKNIEASTMITNLKVTDNIEGLSKTNDYVSTTIAETVSINVAIQISPNDQPFETSSEKKWSSILTTGEFRPTQTLTFQSSSSESSPVTTRSPTTFRSTPSPNVSSIKVSSAPKQYKTSEHNEALPMNTNLKVTYDPMTDNIEGLSKTNDYAFTTVTQTFSINVAIQISPNDEPFESSSEKKRSSILTTGEFKPTQTLTFQLSSPEPSPVTTRSPTTLRSVTTKCTCVCKERRAEVDEKILNITKELSLNTTRLSSFIRKKTSAMDSRTTARASGILGLVILVLTGLGFVFVDAITLGSKLCGKCIQKRKL